MAPQASMSFPDARHLVTAKIVGDDHLSGLEGGAQDAAHIFQKSFTIHRAIEHPGSRQAILPERPNEGAGLPVAMGNPVHAALALRGATVVAGHPGVDPGFIEKDQSTGWLSALPLLPLLACRPHVRALLLAGVQGFFYGSSPTG